MATKATATADAPSPPWHLAVRYPRLLGFLASRHDSLIFYQATDGYSNSGLTGLALNLSTYRCFLQ